MNFTKLIFASVISLFLLVAHAAQEPPVKSTMEAFLVQVDKKGNETLTPATTAEPGEVIEWQITFTNLTAETQNNLVVTGPVPQATHYVAGSANSEVKAALLVSINNGRKYAAEPMMRTVQNADGSTSTEVVPAEEYTHVRWRSSEPLAGHGSQTFTYRVSVE